MDDIILNMETLMTQFQCKFAELENLLRDTNKEFSRLKTEYVKCVPIAEDSVMSMNDFVSYMSALEEQETENDETSQNISELPLDTEDVTRSDTEEAPVKSADRRQRKQSRTNSFGLQGVILEEDEEEEEKLDEDDIISQTESDIIPSENSDNSVNVRSSLARPCSIPRPTTLSKTYTIKTLKNNNNINNSQVTTENNNSQPRIENNNALKTVQPFCRKPTNLDLVNIRQV